MSISSEAYLVGFNEGYLDQGMISRSQYKVLSFENRYDDGYQAGIQKKSAEEDMANKYRVVCSNCYREIKAGTRVIPTWILDEVPEGRGYEGKLRMVGYNHANCFEAEGPRYDEFGREIDEKPGYIKPENRLNQTVNPASQNTEVYHQTVQNLQRERNGLRPL